MCFITSVGWSKHRASVFFAITVLVMLWQSGGPGVELFCEAFQHFGLFIHEVDALTGIGGEIVERNLHRSRLQRRDQRAVKSFVASAPAMKQRKPTLLKLPRADSLPTTYLK